MSGTKDDSSGSCSETDSLTEEIKSQNISSDHFDPEDIGAAQDVGDTSKRPSAPEDVNVDQELKPKEEAKKYGLCTLEL